VALRLYYTEYRENKTVAALERIHKADKAPADSSSQTEDASTERTETSAWPSQSYLELSNLNEDYLGWLTVYGTQVDLPVVLGADNEFYLNHDFYGEESSYGTLFADCLTDRSETGNLLIYGHHMKNGSMFGSLTDFTDEDFFRENSVVRWEQADGISYYEIFAVLVIPGYEEAEDYLPIRSYQGVQDGDRQTELLQTLKNRAIWWRDLSFYRSDRFLFLVTCDYTRENGRLLLCGRLTG
jgi:sortase B